MNESTAAGSGRAPAGHLWRIGRVAVPVLVLALGCVWWYARAGAPAAGPDATALPLVSVVVPALGEVAATVSLTGLISARNDLPIGVEGDGGRISAVLVEPGDHVHRGQVLARLNPLSAQSQVASAAASLDELKAGAATAEAEYARAARARDSFSVEEFERRRTAALTAQARVKAAEAQLAGARTLWERTTVVAPSSGIVLTRNAEVGQIATPASPPLFRLARDGALEMRGQVAEQDVPHLQVGQSAALRLDGVSRTYTGRVWQIGAIIDPVTRQGTVRIALAADDPNLRPGAFARADIMAGSSIGVILPQTAVLTDDAGSYALIVGDDARVERRAVTVAGARPDGLLVSSGLAGNERVVAIAGAFLRAGEPVRVAPAGGSAVAGRAGGTGQRVHGASAAVRVP